MGQCNGNTNPLCPLGTMGCNYVELPGNSAENVLRSQVARKKDCTNLPALAPGQFDLMIIGGGPSMDDDNRGIVFQDNAGGLILDFLQKAGADLTRVYMTHITKCRPRANRKPTVQEINICRDEYLRKEIELIQPKVVMLVGAVAIRAFNLGGNGSLNAIHGRVFEEKFAGWEEGPTFKVIPTINPAVFFFKPNDKLKARICNDYRIAVDVIKGNEPTEHFIPKGWHLIDTEEKLDWLAGEIEKAGYVAWDTESTGLGFRKATLLCFSFSWGWEGHECAVLPILQHDPDAPEGQTYHTKPSFGALNEATVKRFLTRVFTNPVIAKAAHNYKYDYNVLRWNYGIQCEGVLYDTMVLAHLLDENSSVGLDFCVDLEYGWGDYSKDVRAITGHGKKLRNTYDKVPDAILWPYSATDALGTSRLLRTYIERLRRKPNLYKFYHEETEPLIRPLAKAEFKGALVDINVLNALKTEYEADQLQLATDLRSKTWPDFNPMSNDQVLKAFLNIGVPSVDLEDDSNASGYSTNKNTLNTLIEKKVEPAASLALWIMQYRNRQKLISTYLVNAINDMDDDGRVRYTWFQAGPVTGRLSCRFFHQIPKIDESRFLANKPVMRGMLVVPPGYKYIYGDFSQIELWILAILAKDEEMYNILSGGGDLHRVTAFEFLRSEWPGLTEALISKNNRTEVGKKINFGLAYGSEGFSLVNNGKWFDANNVERNFTWDMLNQGMARWKKRFKGVGEFIEFTPDFVRGNGCVATNVFGRERRYGPVLNSYKDGERKAAERECINFFIQSVASCLTNRTIIEVEKILMKYDVPENVVCLINTVHDSVAYEVRDSHVEWFTDALRAISTRPIPELENNCFNFDIGVGQNWAAAEGV